MDQDGVAGFMVALRNNGTTSLYVNNFKCRIFRHSFDVAPVGTTSAWNALSSNDMKCPDGSVRLVV
jgi:hypothetical protein